MPSPTPSRCRARFAPIALAVLAAAFGGCGGPGGSNTATAELPSFGRHGGPLLSLPGGAVAEVVTEQAGANARIVAYFFASDDQAAPLSPAPTEVSVEVAMPGGESTSVPLSPGGGPSRFASSPGDYVYDPFSGTLHATIDGQSVSVPFTTAE